MDTTDKLGLPYILPAQAQKHVTHNEALRQLDIIVQASVENRVLTSPPSAPQPAVTYLVAAPATDVWEGQENKLAAWQDNSWAFYAPQTGMRVWVNAENVLIVWGATEWIDINSGTNATIIQNQAHIGINTTADDTNRLSVSSPATLLNHEGAGHRLTLNKNTPSDTASMIFQSNFSGHAELGLTGDTDFHIKVSPDGQSFLESLTIDKASGRIRFPQSRYSEKAYFNLYPYHGRFAEDKGLNIGAFSEANFLVKGNGTSVSSYGKFINNNTDYGGTAGNMASEIKDLIDQIRQSAFRRYGPEFHVAQYIMGAGKSSPVSAGGQLYYFSVVSALKLRPPTLTVHMYLRALDNPLLLLTRAGQTTFINGEAHQSNVTISPDQDWIDIMIHDETPPSASISYQPNFIQLYAAQEGDRYLMACPSISPGIVHVDPNLGLMMSYDNWS